MKRVKGGKVLRRGRFSRRGGTIGESVNLLDVIRILKRLFEGGSWAVHEVGGDR